MAGYVLATTIDARLPLVGTEHSADYEQALRNST